MFVYLVIWGIRINNYKIGIVYGCIVWGIFLNKLSIILFVENIG